MGTLFSQCHARARRTEVPAHPEPQNLSGIQLLLVWKDSNIDCWRREAGVSCLKRSWAHANEIRRLSLGIQAQIMQKSSTCHRF